MARLTINAGESTGTRDPKHGKPVMCTGGSGPALRVAEYPDGSFTVETLPACAVLSEHESYPEALIGLRVAWMARTTPTHPEDDPLGVDVTSLDALALDIEDGRASCD